MIKATIEDKIVIITLSKGNTNSIDLETLRQMDTIVQKTNNDDSLNGIILTGSGRFFSSGFYLPDFIAFKEFKEICKWFEEEEELLINFFTCKKPVVCAMNGHSVAAGLILAFASDYRIVKNHPKIKLGMSEIKIGLPLSIAQSAIVRFGIDSNTAYRNLMYFGEMINVEQAYKIGIIDEIVQEENLIKRAKEIINLWINTPNKPFIAMKKTDKQEVVKTIMENLKDDSLKEVLKCFLNTNVKETLKLVQTKLEPAQE